MGFLKHYLNGRVASFATAQIFILFGGILRLPIISTNAELSVLAQFVLYTALISVIPVLVSGKINGARIQAVRSIPLEGITRWGISDSLIQLVALSVFTINFTTFQESGLGEISIIVSTAHLIFHASPSFGWQQGLGKFISQNLSQGIASGIGLLAVYLVVHNPTWVGYSEVQQTNLLIATAGVASATPYLFAWISQRRNIDIPRKRVTDSSIQRSSGFVNGIRELASTLPPAALTFFDAVALQWLSSPYQLAVYGISQRVSSLSSFMTGANYTKEANEVIESNSVSPKQALFRVFRFVALNSPFLALFAFAGSPLVSFLSSGKVQVDGILIGTYLVLAVLQPAWVVSSNLVFLDSAQTHILAKRIILFVVPMSVALTCLGAEWYGSTGVVSATCICYALAIALACHIYWKRTYVS